MTPNKQTVTRYMNGFRATDRDLILSCLTDDVTWKIPGMFEVREGRISRLVSYLVTANPA